ncbi:MAG: hypothetical protein ABI560_13625 [Myxococcales bacterium]
MPRARRRRREDERAARTAARRRERLATLLVGGDADHPIDVSSAAVVEVQARATPCIQCQGELAVRADRASSTARGVLRELEMVCRLCHAPRHLWFRVSPTLQS